MNEYQTLLLKLDAENFVLQDVELYLDTHPNCPNGLALYRKFRELRDQTAAEYERTYGPLSVSGVRNGDSWTWVETPWPWERMGW